MHLSAQKIIDYCAAILSNSELNVDEFMEMDTGDAMLPPEETSFIVVESKRAINQNNYRVCVPRTWITCNIPGKVAFGYPAGDEDSIAMRVKNKEPADKNWNTHIGVIQFESESYEEAVGSLQTSWGETSEQIEDNSNQQSHVEAVDLETTCGGNSEPIEDKDNQKSYVNVVDLETICGGNSKPIEDKDNQKSHLYAVDLVTMCGGNSEPIEDKDNQKSHGDALDLETIGRGYREPIEDKDNQRSYEEAVDLETIGGGCSVQIEDISDEISHVNAVDLETICGGNCEPIEDKDNQKSHEDIVYLDTIGGGDSEQIEDNSNQIELVTEPKNSLKLRLILRKVDQKSEKKKKSEKKRHRKHSKDKVHKSKHKYMEQLSLTDNIIKGSSPNSVGTQVRTESCMSYQADCQSAESSSKSLESEISNSGHSVPETHLKNNNNNSYSSKTILLESLHAKNENNDGMLSEDQQLVENMYINIIRHVQYMKTTALEMKKSQLIATENNKTLDQLAAKYRIPLHVTGSVEKEKGRKDYPFEEVKKFEVYPFDEENLQDVEMETQDDDSMENGSQVTEENDNTSEENLLEERENPDRLLESDSDSQIYTDDESIEDYLPSSPEVVKYKGKAISKANDIHTLKHPYPGKGLIQIGRNSRIYINAAGLARAKRTSKDVKQFARELFKEAFTPKALCSCSMTGFAKPALHYRARTILKRYALKYGQDVGWVSIDHKELEKNLSKFLANTRRNRLRKTKT